MKRLVLLCIAASVTTAQADPLLASWFTANSGQYARIYTTDAAQTAGTKSTTWSRGAGVQTNPVYADVNEVNYSANWVYIRTSGLASHTMGPWYATAARTNLFINYPSNTASVYRIPRNPTVPTTKTKTGGGTIGRFVNGVSFFDNRDAFSYVTASGTEVNPGDGIWARNAFPVEGVTFDAPLAHQANNNYHYHVQPIALRYQLGDHVDYNATTNRYTESTAPVTQHSPILAWASDGFPIYGPNGYSDPTNAASGVRRMISGFTLRDGTKGTTNLTTTGRTTLPAWAAAVQNRSAALTAAQYGPAVSATFPLSRYLEDHDFLGDLGFIQTTGSTVRDFDLDKFNGRICVTPDFPTPHFCYFTTINADGTPAYPYTVGRTFYGNPTGGATTAAVMTADTPLTQQFIGGANTPLTPVTASISSPNVTLTWSAVEGGTYSVDASPNQSTWTSKATGLVSTSTSKSSTYATLASTGTEYGRVTRTALATYDSNGQTAATIAQSAIASYAFPNTAPTISDVTDQSIGVNSSTSALAFTVGDAETSVGALIVSGASSNQTLVPNANIALGGSGANRTVTIAPAANQYGSAIISITVSDGSLSGGDTFTLTVTATPRQVWWISHLGTTNYTGSAAADADPEGDGVQNLAEWAFGLDPVVQDAGGIVVSGAIITQRGTPVVTIANTAFGVDYRALFGRRKDYIAAGLVYTVQFSAELSTWEASTDTPTVIASDSEMDAVTVPYPLFLQSGEKAQFFRVNITLP